jgi:hypothetical protein
MTDSLCQAGEAVTGQLDQGERIASMARKKREHIKVGKLPAKIYVGGFTKIRGCVKSSV